VHCAWSISEKLIEIIIKNESLNGTFSMLIAADNVLNNLHGNFPAGGMSALLSASGREATTLLNILSGFQRKDFKGSFTISNEAGDEFNGRSSYVMKHAALHKLLTVHESMKMAIAFKFGKAISETERDVKIVAVLKSMELLNEMSVFVSQLSADEQKRLMIALELVDDPQIMFLDEPTTGLDCSSTLKYLKLLRNLQDITIICAIHQPTALMLEMFDHLYVLADGKCIYQGSNKNIVPFLAELSLICPPSNNPADYLIESNEQLQSKMRNGKCQQFMVLPETSFLDYEVGASRTMRSTFREFQQLTYRNILSMIREWHSLAFRILVYVLMAFLFSILYFDVGSSNSHMMNDYKFICLSAYFLACASFYSLLVKCKFYCFA